jgi:hypothetical protein
MSLTATQLRKNVYRVLDEILETGRPVEIERKGRMLRIDLVEPRAGSKLSRLERRPEVIVGDPDDLVEIDWSAEWNP